MHKTVIMECAHYVLVTTPTIGAVHYCRKCGACKEVTKVVPEILIACNSCRYRRRNNAGEYQARRVAARHTNATGHGVVLTQEGRELFRIDDQVPLPTCDMIPF